MNAPASPASDTRTRNARRLTRSWLFTKLFATIGFLSGGLVVFLIGFRAFLATAAPSGRRLVRECYTGWSACDGFWHTASCGRGLPCGRSHWRYFGLPLALFQTGPAKFRTNTARALRWSRWSGSERSRSGQHRPVPDAKGAPHHRPSYARCSAAISNFFMRIIAVKARCAAALSALPSISNSAVGVICQVTPNLSVSQPHSISCPPAESSRHSLSISS